MGLKNIARGGALAALISGLALVPTNAGAATPGQLPVGWADGENVSPTVMPPSVSSEMARCPGIQDFPEETGIFLGCLKITAYDGQLKLGDQVATIADPIEVVVGLGAIQTGPAVTDIEAVTVPAKGGGGQPTAVKIPGGLLGNPALDPIADNTLGLLSVSATPRLGAAGVDSDGLDFLAWLQGLSGAHPQVLSMPLSIKLNNLLFGSRCQIPEFTIKLSTGTTVPPVGVPPISGADGVHHLAYWTADTDTYEPYAQLDARIGSSFVDNTFAIDQAHGCDLVFGDLLKQPKGLFDDEINKRVGLPSAAGNNYAKFKIDTLFTSYQAGAVYSAITSVPVSSHPLDFGSVPVGQSSAEKTVTMKNVGALAATRNVVVEANTDQYQVTQDGCTGVLVQPQGTCAVKLRFKPTSTGVKPTSLRFDTAGRPYGGQPTRAAMTATGTPAVVTPPAPPAAPAPKPCQLIRIGLFGLQICI